MLMNFVVEHAKNTFHIHYVLDLARVYERVVLKLGALLLAQVYGRLLKAKSCDELFNFLAVSASPRTKHWRGRLAPSTRP